MVTNSLPLFYVRPEKNHETKTNVTKPSSHVKHELVRSSSTPAMNEQLYDYAETNKHTKIYRQNSDVTAAIVASPISPTSTKSEPDGGSNFEGRRPVPKPRKKKIERSRSEANLVDPCDEMCDTPYPYETVSVTFNDSAEKLYRESTDSSDSGDLPPAPHTFDLHFHSHSGWLVKLSKQKGMWYMLCVI